MRQYYPDPEILPDSILVAKILILAARLYNALHTSSAADIEDALQSLQFYAQLIAKRHGINPPPERHEQYNHPFPVAQILTPQDIIALILHKALRLHSIYHKAAQIHIDSAADLLGYLQLLDRAGVPSGSATRAGHNGLGGGRC